MPTKPTDDVHRRATGVRLTAGGSRTASELNLVAESARSPPSSTPGLRGKRLAFQRPLLPASIGNERFRQLAVARGRQLPDGSTSSRRFWRCRSSRRSSPTWFCRSRRLRALRRVARAARPGQAGPVSCDACRRQCAANRATFDRCYHAPKATGVCSEALHRQSQLLLMVDASGGAARAGAHRAPGRRHSLRRLHRGTAVQARRRRRSCQPRGAGTRARRWRPGGLGRAGHCRVRVAEKVAARKLRPVDVAARAEVTRIARMWTALLGAAGGPLLFGGFSIADACFAPRTCAA